MLAGPCQPIEALLHEQARLISLEDGATPEQARRLTTARSLSLSEIVREILPGNPAEVMLGDTATPESVAALEARQLAAVKNLDEATLWRMSRNAKTVADGQAVRTFSVSILDDALVEGAETVQLALFVRDKAPLGTFAGGDAFVPRVVPEVGVGPIGGQRLVKVENTLPGKGQGEVGEYGF